MHSTVRFRAVLFLALIHALSAGAARAQSAGITGAGESGEREALWELGMGAGILFAPDYPASSEHQLRGLALPFLIYRGETFRIGDGEVARAIALDRGRIELDLSFDAAFDASSEDNALRENMPDLDFLFEVGPQLTLRLNDPEQRRITGSELDLALRARAVFSTDLSRVDQRGYIFEPALEHRRYFLDSRLETSVSVIPRWASRKLQQYFYEVPVGHATAQRPAYEARSGYLGTELRLGADYSPHERLTWFGALYLNSHAGAASSASPLWEEKMTAGLSAGFLWTFLESERREKDR